MPKDLVMDGWHGVLVGRVPKTYTVWPERAQTLLQRHYKTDRYVAPGQQGAYLTKVLAARRVGRPRPRFGKDYYSMHHFLKWQKEFNIELDITQWEDICLNP